MKNERMNLSQYRVTLGCRSVIRDQQCTSNCTGFCSLSTMVQIGASEPRTRSRSYLLTLTLILLSLLVPFELYTLHNQQHALKDQIAVSTDFCRLKPSIQKALKAHGDSFIVAVTVPDLKFIDFFQNWWHFYEKLEHRPPVVVLAPSTDVFDAVKALGIDVYLDQCSLNIAARLQPLLQEGFNVFYTDIDTVWKQNAVNFIHVTEDYDAWFAVDQPKFRGFEPYYSSDLMALRATPETIQLVERWRYQIDHVDERPSHMREFLPKSTQPLLNQVLHFEESHHLRRHVVHTQQAALRHGSMPTEFFPNGKEYFTKMSEEDRTKVAVVHNNFILGHDKMKERFRSFGLWWEG